MKRNTKRDKTAADKLAKEIGWHRRYAEIESRLSDLDPDAAEKADLEIELAGLASLIEAAS